MGNRGEGCAYVCAFHWRSVVCRGSAAWAREAVAAQGFGVLFGDEDVGPERGVAVGKPVEAVHIIECRVVYVFPVASPDCRGVGFKTVV